MPDTAKDPENAPEPEPTPAPPASAPEESELSAEELGNVSGGLINIQGGLRPANKTDVL